MTVTYIKKISSIIILICICSCSSSKETANKTKYFNENNNEISKAKFNRIRSTNRLLDVSGDSINQKKLTARKKRGNITNRSYLELLLKMSLNKTLDSTKPLVIIYYPGKDPCNSSGSSTRESRKLWFTELEEGVYQIAQTKPIYLFKDSEGLKKYYGILSWHKDPDSTFEHLFFKHHYPCGSFVVIANNGDYISYFGEYSKDSVWEATQLMNK